MSVRVKERANLDPHHNFTATRWPLTLSYTNTTDTFRESHTLALLAELRMRASAHCRTSRQSTVTSQSLISTVNSSFTVTQLQRLVLLVVCLLTPPTATLLVSASTNASPTPVYSNIYADNIFLAPLTPKVNLSAEDAAIAGNLSWFPSQWAGTALPQSVQTDGMVTFNVMLPHAGDNINSCPGSGLWNTTNEFGQSFAGAFVLIQKSISCTSQFLNAQKAGMAGLIVYGCPSYAPFNCDPTLQSPSIFVPGTTARMNIPIISIKATDGARIIQYLQAKAAEAVAAGTVPAIDTLTISLKSSGPIVPEERAALIAIMNQTTMTDFAGKYVADLPPWSVARFSNMSLDPCLDRVFGLWCEDGHVVVISPVYHYWRTPSTGAPMELGLLTKVRYFDIQLNAWSGPIPSSICSWTDIRTISIEKQQSSGITSLPNCDFPLLQELKLFVNAFTQLPASFSNWTSLTAVYAPDNKLTSLPSVAKLTKLQIFDVAENQIVGSFPDFSPLAPLSIVSLATNSFTGAIASNLFDGMSSLTILDLNANRLSGPLPYLRGCTALTILDLSGQRDITNPNSTTGFTGPQPSTWTTTLTKLTKLHLQQNLLTSPFNTAQMYNLLDLDLSYNLLTFDQGSLGALIKNLISPSMSVLRLSYNLLSGPWGGSDQSTMQNIRKLYADHNEISDIASTLFLTGLTTLDLSYNNLSTPVAGTLLDWTSNKPSSAWEYLNLQGNPNFQYATIPSWITPLSTKVQDSNSPYSCHTFGDATAPMMTLLLDPTFHMYKYCDCQAGTFGRPPLCAPVPNHADLNPFAVISSDEIGVNYPTLIAETGGLGTQAQSFSDSMYGQNRLTLGITTSWVVNLLDLYADDVDAYIALGETPPSPLKTYTIDPSVTTPNSMWTPVRVTTIRLHVSASLFTEFEDVISVYEGGSDLKGTRVFTIRGTDSKPLSDSSEYTDTPAYQMAYNSSIAQIDDPRLIEIPVYSPEVTVQFTSRDISGNHFYATYSYDFTCPSGMFYDTVTDPSTPHCRLNRVIFQVGMGLRAAVFAVSAATLAFVTFNLVVLAIKWETLIYKAASRSFMLLILILLEFMALGALLYGAIPSQMNSVGNALCQGRAWLTCLPLAGILAVLLAKNNRLDAIFGSTKLQVRAQTDFDILKVVIAVSSGQILLLAFFSGLPLSRPELTLGKGSLSEQLVYQCSQESGFMSWLGAEIAFICALMLAAAYLGFRTRDLPSQYNESAHIQNAVILLMFFCVIIIPLDIFIQDSPEAAVLIQGLGQSFLCLTLTAILFGPKLYYLASNPVGRIGQQDKAEHTRHATSASDETLASGPVVGKVLSPNARMSVIKNASSLNNNGGSASITPTGATVANSLTRNGTPGTAAASMVVTKRPGSSGPVAYPITAIPAAPVSPISNRRVSNDATIVASPSGAVNPSDEGCSPDETFSPAVVVDVGQIELQPVTVSPTTRVDDEVTPGVEVAPTSYPSPTSATRQLGQDSVRIHIRVHKSPSLSSPATSSP